MKAVKAILDACRESGWVGIKYFDWDHDNGSFVADESMNLMYYNIECDDKGVTIVSKEKDKATRFFGWPGIVEIYSKKD